MPNQVVNTFGLLLNIVGIVLLFFFGPPQPTFEEGVGLGLEDGNLLENGKTVKEYNADIRKLKRHHENMSRFALFLIFIGFIVQLLATWLV